MSTSLQLCLPWVCINEHSLMTHNQYLYNPQDTCIFIKVEGELAIMWLNQMRKLTMRLECSMHLTNTFIVFFFLLSRQSYIESRHWEQDFKQCTLNIGLFLSHLRYEFMKATCISLTWCFLLCKIGIPKFLVNAMAMNMFRILRGQ